MNYSNNTSIMNATKNGPVHRIRTPHTHDVLSGRGGGINGHPGNVQFREFVRVRKTDYNLAPSKVEKARVAQEVIALVRQQDPPGRFLQKDTSAGIGNWWVELDQDRVVAKTSQALREGAPSIRAAHQKEVKEIKAKVGTTGGRKSNAAPRKTTQPVPNKAVFSAVSSPLKRNLEPTATQWPAPVSSNHSPAAGQEAEYHEKAMLELRSNVEQARLRNDLLENDPVIRAEKRMRVDEAGSAAPMALAPPPMVPRQGFGSEQRQNSLALSEFSFDAGMEEFVNPFAEETEDVTNNKPPRSISIDTFSIPSTPRSEMNRDTSALSLDVVPKSPLPVVPKPEPIHNRSKSGQSAATQISKLDWDDSDPLLQYLTNLDRGVAAQ